MERDNLSFSTFYIYTNLVLFATVLSLIEKPSLQYFFLIYEKTLNMFAWQIEKLPVVYSKKMFHYGTASHVL